MLHSNIDLEFWNKKLNDKSPDEIIEWALFLTNNRIVTTSFGVYSAVLLSTLTNHDSNIRVIWCDTLFNGGSTYEHAAFLSNKFNLNLYKYQPLLTKSEIESHFGVPGIQDSTHHLFSEVVKIEPFKRALTEHKPDLWFTNIRHRQTELRDKKDILSFSRDNILKVSPFYYWTDFDLDNYLEVHRLPKNKNYFDPIKGNMNRECGIHLQ